MRIVTSLLALLLTFPAFSAWQLVPEASSVNFITYKKTNIAENQKFTRVKGEVSDEGKVNFNIDLTSVFTNIEIRDERIKTFLFETELFPSATFTAQIEPSLLSELALGSSKEITINGTIDLHGQKQKVSTNVLVLKLTVNKIVVVSTQSLLIKADDFSLIAGINKLKALAKLPSITTTVPVNFVLTYAQ